MLEKYCEKNGIDSNGTMFLVLQPFCYTYNQVVITNDLNNKCKYPVGSIVNWVELKWPVVIDNEVITLEDLEKKEEKQKFPNPWRDAHIKSMLTKE